MRPATFTVAALLILVAAATGLYKNREDRKAAPEPVASIKDADVRESNETVTTLSELGTKPERILLTDIFSAPIFSDVPESELDHQTLEGFLGARPIGAYRIVRIDSDGLRTKIRQSNDVPEFNIQLLDSEPMQLRVKVAQEHSAGWQSGLGSWRGTVVGDETSRASFVVAPDATVNGVVRTLRTGRIKIEPIKGTPHHIVWQWDPSYERNLD